MPEDFVPTTSMERAYVQARKWPADRAWRRAYVEMEEGHACAGIGMYLCLLDHYARRDGVRELFDTCEWLLNRTVELKPAERLSVCRIVCHVVKSLKEDEFDLNEARLKLILRIPLAVILEAVAEQRLSCALTGLLEFSRVFEESLTLKRCSEFEGDFRGVALSIDRAIRAGRVRDDIQKSEERSLEAIDVAEQRIKAWKEFKESQKSAQSTAPEEPVQIPWPEQPQQQVESDQASNSASHGLVESDEPTLNPANLSKLSKAENLVEASIKMFGVQSAETAHRIAELIEVKSECFPDLATDDDLRRLSEIVSDGSIDISPYVLRKVLSAVGSTDERKNLLTVLTIIEESVLQKREKQFGLDISLGITLWRLICLWRSNDCLPEGSAYCEVLQRRLADKFGAYHPVVKQVNSAIGFLSALQAGRFKFEENFLGAQSKKTKEAAEFVAMLATVALDEMSRKENANAEKVLNELICFYSDTVGDTRREVGEMLWLLQETKINQMQSVASSLIVQSHVFACDQYLDERLKLHVKRIVSLIDDQNRKNELLSVLLLAKQNSIEYSKALEETKNILSLCSYAESYESEAAAEHKFLKAGKELKSKSTATLLKLEKYCMEQNWIDFAKVLEKDGASIDADETYYSLLQICFQLLKHHKLTFCEKISAMLFAQTNRLRAGAFNLLTERFKAAWVEERNWQCAVEKLELALSGKFQSPEQTNRLRLQMAEMKVEQGNLFEATALLYQAFSQIPEAESAKDVPLIEGK